MTEQEAKRPKLEFATSDAMKTDEAALPTIPAANEPDQPSLLQLNDDCLMLLFTYLSDGELYAVSQCATRLYANASRTFPRRFATRRTFINQLPSIIILEQFGNCFKDLHLSDVYRLGIEEVNCMHRLCPNITSLSGCFAINAFSTPQLGDIFSKLKELRLKVVKTVDQYDANHILNTMQRCKELHSLHLDCAPAQAYLRILSIEYPQLRKLTLRAFRHIAAGDLLVQFIHVHRQIQDLSISLPCGNGSALLEILELKHLETLDIGIYCIGEDFTLFNEQLSNMSKLRKLRLDSLIRDMPTFAHIKQINALEIFTYSYNPIDPSHFNDVARMENLTDYKLHTFGKTKLRDVVWLVNSCLGLDDLWIRSITCEASQYDETHTALLEICQKEKIGFYADRDEHSFIFENKNIINVIRSISNRIWRSF